MTQGNHRFVVKRTATGLGLFAVESIPAGKRIIEYNRPLISTAEIERRHGKYFFEVNTARYINHSCRPNAESFVSGKRV